jgi:hypothetical protein
VWRIAPFRGKCGRRREQPLQPRLLLVGGLSARTGQRGTTRQQRQNQDKPFQDRFLPGRAIILDAMRTFIAFVAVVLLSVPAAGQNPDAEPPNPLSSLKQLKCRFPVAASAVWKGGDPQAQTKMQELLFEINAIDVQDGTAEYLGTAGRAYVTAVLSGWSLYFVENAVGQLNVTTVFAQEAAPKRLKAVHSRHGYLQMTVGKFVAEPSVSQNYGECEVVQ